MAHTNTLSCVVPMGNAVVVFCVRHTHTAGDRIENTTIKLKKERQRERGGEIDISGNQQRTYTDDSDGLRTPYTYIVQA